jgi:hypothetical protein
MHPTALAAHKRASAARKPSPSEKTWVSGNKRSGALRALRMVTALAASLVLVVSLVDPLSGSERLPMQGATQEQGVRHE